MLFSALNCKELIEEEKDLSVCSRVVCRSWSAQGSGNVLCLLGLGNAVVRVRVGFCLGRRVCSVLLSTLFDLLA